MNRTQNISRVPVTVDSIKTPGEKHEHLCLESNIYLGLINIPCACGPSMREYAETQHGRFPDYLITYFFFTKELLIKNTETVCSIEL